MNKKIHDHGFTIKRATEHIYKREDNTYNKKTIEKILKMYAEECMETLINGEKINIKGVGTIRPNIIHSVHCGLPVMKNREESGEDSSYTVARLNICTSNILKEQLKERLSENLKMGIDGLKGGE
jgi:hypothetical protein